MEMLYLEYSLEDTLAGLEKEFAEQWETIQENSGAAVDFVEAVATFEKDKELVIAMVSGYPSWVAESGIDKDWDTVSVEEAAIIEIPGAAHDLPMRMDLVQRNKRSEKLRVRDFKTCKSFPTDMAQYQLSEQNGNYLLGGMAIYDELITEFSYVFLRKIIPSNRSKPPYYKEEILYRTGAELQHRVKEFCRISNEIADGYEVYASPENCCGSWKNDWKAPCMLVHAGMDSEEALNLVPGFVQADTYKERYGEVINDNSNQK